VPQTFKLTEQQRREFVEQGLTRVAGAIAEDVIDAMAARIQAAIERHGGAPQSWQLTQMANAGVFAPMLSPGLGAVLEDFFGGPWNPPALAPRPLGLTFPTPDRPWNVPTLHWHLDRVGAAPPRPADAADRDWPACVRVFACLQDVEPGGAGTVYVAGSHRAVNHVVAEMRETRERIPSAAIVKRLKGESSWIADLCSRGEETPGRVERFMDDGTTFRQTPLRVAEMTGQRGDVILWHPNLLHTFSPANARSTPRMALSVTIDAARQGG
jgi:hypothetical protein